MSKGASRTPGTWLVTGGAGFIGSNFVRLALADQAPVAGLERLVVLDKLTYAGHLENLESCRDDERFTFVEGDIADREAVQAVFESHTPDAVINFAAESHVDRSIDDPGAFVRTNVVGTFELLEATRRATEERRSSDSPGVCFLHISTDEVFGSLGAEGAFSETTPYDPRSPYSASKAAADHLVSAYGHTYDLPVLLTNCSNNYGPYQYPEKLIPVMILNALEGRDLPIYGDGLNVRDWLHVEDHCLGILSVLEKGEALRSYNIGGHGERNNLEVIAAICAALEKHAPAAENEHLEARGMTSYDELKRFVKDRPGHDRRYAIDPTRIETELGWQPQRSFEEGIEATVVWYLENREWCNAVQSGNERVRLGLGSATEKTQRNTVAS